MKNHKKFGILVAMLFAAVCFSTSEARADHRHGQATFGLTLPNLGVYVGNGGFRSAPAVSTSVPAATTARPISIGAIQVVAIQATDTPATAIPTSTPTTVVVPLSTCRR